jgi:hypothetical protein
MPSGALPTHVAGGCSVLALWSLYRVACAASGSDFDRELVLLVTHVNDSPTSPVFGIVGERC